MKAGPTADRARTERLAADAPNMRRPGADLIAWYLNPDRLPAERRWSRKHADTQRRLCGRLAVPVIGAVTCQDIKTRHTQAIVNAAPTSGEGERARRIARVITVDRKVVEVGGRLASRVAEARGEQEGGANPFGLVFPSPGGRYWRSSNFSRGVT